MPRVWREIWWNEAMLNLTNLFDIASSALMDLLILNRVKTQVRKVVCFFFKLYVRRSYWIVAARVGHEAQFN